MTGALDVGQGSGTRIKEALVSSCFGFWLRRWGPGLARANTTYYHLDLNAGPGDNHDAGVRGAASLFVEKLDKYPALSSHVTLIEKSRDSMAALRRRVRNGQGLLPFVARDIDFIQDDNTCALDGYLQRDVPRTAIGSVLCDPNGPVRGMVALPCLAKALLRLPRFLFVAQYDVAAGLRMRGSAQKAPEKKCPTSSVTDILRLPRAHWLISDRYAHGRRYVILCGSHVSLPPYELLRPTDAHPMGVGLHNVTSARGRGIVRSTFSRDERAARKEARRICGIRETE